MARALQLAEKGLYSTDPNPRVGCVLVKDNRIVGEGWHEFAGGPHAEINALAQAGSEAKGATAYVSLEPCCHYGRTPPCTNALIEAGIKRVVAAMEDPNPTVGGDGLKQLSAAGISVQSGILQHQAEALNPGFVNRMRHQRPFVRCKLAMSVDGRTAMASGESQWITGEDARLDVQRLRARSSAIMTGIGTVLLDDPLMTVRLIDPLSANRQPLRVIVDSHLRMPSQARLLAQPGRTLIVTSGVNAHNNASIETGSIDVIALDPGDGGVDLKAALSYLADRAVNEVLLEAGATLSGAMLRAGLIDELVLYMAPVLLGDGARGLFKLPGLDKMEQRLGLEIEDLRAVGQDWRITAKVKY